MSDLPRTPVHTFGEALRPRERRHAADFDACLSWPHCGCIRDCAAEAGERTGGMRFWLALALACVVPVLFGAALLSTLFLPDLWSFAR